MPAPDPSLIVRNPPPLNPEASRFPHRVEPLPWNSIFTLAALAPAGAYVPPAPDALPTRFSE